MYLTIKREGLQTTDGPVTREITYEEAENLYVHRIGIDHCVTIAPVHVYLGDYRFKIRTGYSWNLVTKLSTFYRVSALSVFTTLVHDFVYDTHVMDKQMVDDWFLDHYRGLINFVFRRALGSRFSDESWSSSVNNTTNIAYAKWALPAGSIISSDSEE